MEERVMTYCKTQAKSYDQFHQFILKQFHPCIMARSVFTNQQVRLEEYKNPISKTSIKAMLAHIREYVTTAAADRQSYYSFIAVFPEEKITDEIEYECFFWNLLKQLHQADMSPWAEGVSDNPENPKFSFSLCGEAFYIVGLHPHSSRLARRAPYPALVFNLHDQFEKLRETGAYHVLRDKIRQRDVQLQGSINPMLADFGKSTEARQYSGREVEADWKCPFSSKKKI